MRLSAVLLAGGESRRMGRDKATVRYDGEMLWQRQIRLLRDIKPDHIFLSARREEFWHPRDIELLLDDPACAGPLPGITAALSRMTTSHLLVLAIDMPLLETDDVLKLVSLAEEGCGVVRVVNKRAEPLAAIYPKESLPDFEAASRNDSGALQPVVKELARKGKVRLVQLSEAEAERFRSMNTPEDLIALRACR